MPLECKKPLTFFVDAMLGNIAKKLRLMGFDSKYSSDIKDDELLSIAKNENRIIISRDKELIHKAQKYGLDNILIESEIEFDQIKAIVTEFNLKKIQINGDNARCPKCNSKTSRINKKNVQKMIPQKILENNEIFWKCGSCEQFFWEGTHIQNLQKFVREINER